MGQDLRVISDWNSYANETRIPELNRVHSDRSKDQSEDISLHAVEESRVEYCANVTYELKLLSP